MGSIQIITLIEDQWEDYKNLRLKALKDNPESFGQTYDKAIRRSDDEWKMLLTKSAKSQKRWVVFAQLNGELVGMVSGTEMESNSNGVKIQEMFVAKEVRRDGIATKLMKGLSTRILESSERRVLRLNVFKDQEDAVALYKSLGFEIIEEKTEHFDGGIVHQSLAMEKRLSKRPPRPPKK